MHYRVYTLNDANRIARAPQIIECADDRDAIEQARQIVEDSAVEVWERSRRIIRLDPQQTSDCPVQL